jgi:uncharacterized protein
MMSPMVGESRLAVLLRSLDPELRPDRLVFTTVERPPAGMDWMAMVKEDEGVTLVVTQDLAVRDGLPYDYVAAMITLRVHSKLASVGLTAAVAAALARAGISCNVVAGRFHDHLFVPFHRRHDALDCLRSSSQWEL